MKRQTKFSLIFAIPTAIIFEYGNLLQSDQGIANFQLANLFNIVLTSVAFFILARVLIHLLDRITPSSAKSVKISKFSKKSFFLIWGLILLCWLPYFLAFYPGIWAYDVGGQLIHNDTADPLIHSHFLRLCLGIGRAIRSENFGVAIATVLQMLFMSGVMSYLVERVHRLARHRYSHWFLAAFFALMPFNPIMAISATKDVSFAAFVVLSAVFAYDFIKFPSGQKFPWYKYLALIVSLAFMMLLRNNGLYVVAVWCIIGLIFIAKTHKKRFLCVGLSSFALYGAIFAAFFYIGGASSSRLEYEAFCVPFQTIIGTAIRHPEIVPAYGEHQSFLGIADRDLFPEYIGSSFHPYTADSAKFNFVNIKGIPKTDLIKAWLKLSAQYPGDSLDIWGRLTLSSWHIPSDDYNHVYTNWARGYLEFAALNTEAAPNVQFSSKLPWLKQEIEYYLQDNNYTKNPIVFVLFSPALYLWAIIFLILYLCYRRHHSPVIAIVLPLLLYGTVLLGPCILVRYMYPIMLAAPVFYFTILPAISTSPNKPARRRLVHRR